MRQNRHHRKKSATMFENVLHLRFLIPCIFSSIFTAACSTGVERQYLLVVEVLNILDRLVHEARVNIG